MAIDVLRDFFTTREQVLDDIKRDGFWPTTLITPVAPELPMHWHDCDVHAYVMQGSSWIRDGRDGGRLSIGAGDKLVIPKGELHAEGETSEPMLYIVALSEPRSQKAFLRMHGLQDTA